MNFFLVLCFFLSQASYADMLTINYFPNFNINGDEEELSDWSDGDDYTYLTLDEDSAFSLRLASDFGGIVSSGDVVGGLSVFFYADYTTYNLEDREGLGEYQSLTAGLSLLLEQEINEYFGSSIAIGVGVGGARFELPESMNRGVAEVFIEGGFSVSQTLYLSVGGKYQAVGEPTETMAHAFGAYLGVSLKF